MKNRFLSGSAVFLLLVLILLASLSCRRKTSVDDLQKMTQKELQKEKLRQEIRKLGGVWGKIMSCAPFFTAIAAVAGVFITIWRYLSQQKAERRQRRDEQFTSIVNNLASESEAVQTSAAVSIMNFLKPEYEDYHEQVFMVLLANLKLERSDVVNGLLIRGFEEASRKHLRKGGDAGLDLSRSNLYRADLSRLDLTGADLAFAKLQSANLTGAILYRTQGWEADLEKARLSEANLEEARFRKAKCSEARFHNARLVSAKLQEADLRKAEFHRAQMQEVHLDKADLRGAKFQQANLKNAFFRGAILDKEALNSITKALNWRKANFDNAVRSELDQLNSSKV